ncbi:nucleotidyl transferase AbiEii/AbiGii toxin family protein [Rhizobium mongolense]|uniref:nucleotidyl transferase AbiEii/AbiGii toxin family protein n=1 Tax=Rhizobium mongolense TaxID=57676 RepID=UPI0035572F96
MGNEVRAERGTSLSKGYRIINRFSEDINIRIEPPAEMNVKAGPNHDKPAHRESRRAFYDWLAARTRLTGKIDLDLKCLSSLRLDRNRTGAP